MSPDAKNLTRWITRACQSLKVDPNSRSYLLKVVSDAEQERILLRSMLVAVMGMCDDNGGEYLPSTYDPAIEWWLEQPECPEDSFFRPSPQHKDDD